MRRRALLFPSPDVVTICSQSTVIKSDPGVNFGFTVLGAVLAILVPWLWRFADQRGWTDPITRQ